MGRIKMFNVCIYFGYAEVDLLCLDCVRFFASNFARFWWHFRIFIFCFSFFFSYPKTASKHCVWMCARETIQSTREWSKNKALTTPKETATNWRMVAGKKSLNFNDLADLFSYAGVHLR